MAEETLRKSFLRKGAIKRPFNGRLSTNDGVENRRLSQRFPAAISGWPLRLFFPIADPDRRRKSGNVHRAGYRGN